MKDIMEAFKTDAFNTLVVYVLPGGCVVYPWYKLVILKHFPGASEIVPKSQSYEGLMLLALAALAGFLIEDLGSRLEVYHDKHPVCCKEVWDKYLVTLIPSDIALRPYMEGIVRRFKSELSLVIAIPLGAVPLILRAYSESGRIALLSGIVTAIVTLYLLFESKTSQVLLSTHRKTAVELFGKSINGEDRE